MCTPASSRGCMAGSLQHPAVTSEIIGRDHSYQAGGDHGEEKR